MSKLPVLFILYSQCETSHTLQNLPHLSCFSISYCLGILCCTAVKLKVSSISACIIDIICNERQDYIWLKYYSSQKSWTLFVLLLLLLSLLFFLNWILVCYKVTWLGGGGEDREVQDSFLSYLKTSVGKELTRSKALAKVS